MAELLAAVYGNPVPYQVAEALHRRTGGNPFFLEELVVTAGRVDPARLATLPLPWNLLQAALASSRDAHRSDLVPVEGWIDPCWIDLTEVALLLEAGRLDQAEALLRRHDDRTGPRATPTTPPGCGPSACGWQPP
ncbi:MAG: hypothetical protein ACJ75A_16970, partial [Actinomycetes bacterium]